MLSINNKTIYLYAGLVGACMLFAVGGKIAYEQIPSETILEFTNLAEQTAGYLLLPVYGSYRGIEWFVCDGFIQLVTSCVNLVEWILSLITNVTKQIQLFVKMAVSDFLLHHFAKYMNQIGRFINTVFYYLSTGLQYLYDHYIGLILEYIIKYLYYGIMQFSNIICQIYKQFPIFKWMFDLLMYFLVTLGNIWWWMKYGWNILSGFYFVYGHPIIMSGYEIISNAGYQGYLVCQPICLNIYLTMIHLFSQIMMILENIINKMSETANNILKFK